MNLNQDSLPYALELHINNKGNIEAMYQEGLAETLDAEIIRVQRASQIEWETVEGRSGRSGWTVRSTVNPKLALRVTDWCRWAPREEGTLVMFQNRSEAIEEEKKFFWQLLIGKE